MDLIDVAKKINLKAISLDSLTKDLTSLATEKARTMVIHDKELAKECYRLKEEGIPVTLIEKIAKGKCADLRGDMDLAESLYKNQFRVIASTETQISAYQTINRYLAEV